MRLAIAAVLLAFLAPLAHATSDTVESQTQRARKGGGLRIGSWDVRGLPEGQRTSATPAFEGYFQTGLDLHLVWENTLGFWQHSQTTTQSGPLTSSQTDVRTYIIPTLTALKFYPLTRHSTRIEPFLNSGVGIALGVERVKTTDTGVAGSSEATTLHTGLGLRVGTGIDWHVNNVFGVTAGYRYQWASFGEDVGGMRGYHGPGLDLGLTYHFQYE